MNHSSRFPGAPVHFGPPHAAFRGVSFLFTESQSDDCGSVYYERIFCRPCVLNIVALLTIIKVLLINPLFSQTENLASFPRGGKP